MPSREQIDLAKERLRIPELWERLELPGKPKPCCHSPFRKDKHPSFLIFDGGRAAKDHATGQNYDGPSFLAESRGLSVAAALSLFVEMAGGAAVSCRHVSPLRQTEPECEPVRKKPDLSKFRTPNNAELRAIARDRGLAVAAPEIAKRLGSLKCGKVCGFHSWILVDPSGRNAEARRFGRLPYPAYGDLDERKAHTILHSSKSWPLGLGVDRALVEKAMLICIVEGGPDLLAAWHFIHRAKRWDVLPIAILGRSVHGLCAEALELLKGKRVRFFPHIDSDGRGFEQMSLIQEQLRPIGCQVSCFDFRGLFDRDGTPINDLNNVADLNPNQFRDLFL